jgi:hypothetical protein
VGDLDKPREPGTEKAHGPLPPRAHSHGSVGDLRYSMKYRHPYGKVLGVGDVMPNLADRTGYQNRSLQFGHWSSSRQ